MEKISVIVPVYNNEKYLHQCIDSILEQSYKNLEIILVDDGSTDGSVQICDEYGQKDDRVKVLHQVNGGISAARNAGLNLASGDYIAFVDSDDFLDKNMYERLLHILQANNADMSVCCFHQIDENGKQFDVPFSIVDEVTEPYSVLKRLAEKRGWVYVVVWNRLYKREIFDNLRFPVNKLHEDEWVALPIYTSCKKVVFTASAYYYYRVNPNSVMGRKNNIKHLDGVEAVYNRTLKYQEYGWTELLPSAYFCARNMLEALKNIKIKGKADRERKKEIVNMYRYVMKSADIRFSIKDRIVGRFPTLYFKLKFMISK